MKSFVKEFRIAWFRNKYDLTCKSRTISGTNIFVHFEGRNQGCAFLDLFRDNFSTFFIEKLRKKIYKIFDILSTSVLNSDRTFEKFGSFKKKYRKLWFGQNQEWFLTRVETWPIDKSTVSACRLMQEINENIIFKCFSIFLEFFSKFFSQTPLITLTHLENESARKVEWLKGGEKTACADLSLIVRQINGRPSLVLNDN